MNKRIYHSALFCLTCAASLSMLFLYGCGSKNKRNNVEATHRVTVSKYDNMETDEHGQIIYHPEDVTEPATVPDTIMFTITNDSDTSLDDIRITPLSNANEMDSVATSPLQPGNSVPCIISPMSYDLDSPTTSMNIFVLPEGAEDYLELGHIGLSEGDTISIQNKKSTLAAILIAESAADDSFDETSGDSYVDFDTSDDDISVLNTLYGTWYLDGDSTSSYYMINSSGKYAFYESNLSYSDDSDFGNSYTSDSDKNCSDYGTITKDSEAYDTYIFNSASSNPKISFVLISPDCLETSQHQLYYKN